ncbi:Asp-tRNA(Asn)/Glu-tRNA(Gln) amidotransferase subunit GatC [Endozoicomonadaceae bacterium StTr2]
MAIDRKEVEAVAHLARLSIDETQIEHTTESLQGILGMIDQMQAIDTKGIEPMAHPLDAVQRLRADEVTETDQREKLQQHAPATEEGLFLVPKVIE